MTKVIVTVGPSTDSIDSARNIVRSGAGGFRFPASKFEVDVLARQAEQFAAMVREEHAELDFFLDLPGSKSRLTNDGGFALAGVQLIQIDYGPTPANHGAAVPVLGVSGVPLGSIVPGAVLITGDGEDALLVEEVYEGHCLVRPLTTGELGRRRGITVVGGVHKYASLTPRDLEALRAIRDTVFSAVIISFVEDADTIVRARETMRAAAGGRALPAVVAKIETRRGARALPDIAREADAVLLGRGDLLLDVGELDFYDIGRGVMKASATAGLPIIVGTQILPSLSDNWLPNRSELSYACHLIEKGVDALLLSTETTIGKQPHRTVEMLTALVKRYGTPTTGRMFTRTVASRGSE